MNKCIEYLKNQSSLLWNTYFNTYFDRSSAPLQRTLVLLIDPIDHYLTEHFYWSKFVSRNKSLTYLYCLIF